MNEPYPAAEVKRLLRECIGNMDIAFSSHALVEMANDNLLHVDVLSTLRGGSPQPGELRGNTWRYRIVTRRIGVVVAFRGNQTIIVTAWRIK